MKTLRLILIIACVLAVGVATAKPRDDAKPEKAKVEQKAPKQERAETRAKPAESSRNSSQKTYTYAKPNSSYRNSTSKPAESNRSSVQKTYTYTKPNSGDRNSTSKPSTWNRDRNTTDKPAGDNRSSVQKTYKYTAPSSGDRNTDRNPGDWNRDGDRDRNPSAPTIDNRDRDRAPDVWNRDRDDNRADKNWRPDRDDRRDDRHKSYDRARDHDGWWQHHRYADKAYKYDAPNYRPFWHIEWGHPYCGTYYNRWHYIPLINVVFRSDKQPPLLGSAIVAYDDTFLGIISRDWQDVDSIGNPYGRFGCPESPWSIWNTDGQWGNYYSFDSPWSPDATRPPRVYSGDYFLGYLTANEDLYPRIDPYWLTDYLDIWVTD